MSSRMTMYKSAITNKLTRQKTIDKPDVHPQHIAVPMAMRQLSVFTAKKVRVFRV